MSARFLHGTPLMVDYTPGSAVAAEELVTVGTEIWIAHNPIAANELGALAAPSSSAVYEVTLATGAIFALGDAVDIDGSGDAATTGTAFGIAVAAADQTSGDTVVRARHGKTSTT